MDLVSSLQRLKRQRLAWDRIGLDLFNLNGDLNGHATPIFKRKQHERVAGISSCKGILVI